VALTFMLGAAFPDWGSRGLAERASQRERCVLRIPLDEGLDGCRCNRRYHMGGPSSDQEEKLWIQSSPLSTGTR